MIYLIPAVLYFQKSELASCCLLGVIVRLLIIHMYYPQMYETHICYISVVLSMRKTVFIYDNNIDIHKYLYISADYTHERSLVFMFTFNTPMGIYIKR